MRDEKNLVTYTHTHTNTHTSDSRRRHPSQDHRPPKLKNGRNNGCLQHGEGLCTHRGTEGISLCVCVCVVCIKVSEEIVPREHPAKYMPMCMCVLQFVHIVYISIKIMPSRDRYVGRVLYI